MTYNVIVIGGGLMGSSVAWQLANYGQKVLLIEQQDQIYVQGSSLGEARIARSLGPKGDLWAYLHDKSILETEKLIAFLNDSGTPVHQLSDIYTTSPVSYIFYDSKPKLGGFESVLNQRHKDCKYAFSNVESHNLFETNLPKNASVLIREFREYSGTMNPKKLIQKLHLSIQRKGGTILYNSKVESLIKTPASYEVKLLHSNTGETQTLFCTKVVSAAGCYNGILLKNIAPYIDKLIKPQRVFLAFFKIRASKFKNLPIDCKNRIMDAYPAIYFNKELSFAMIESIDKDGIPIIKIGGHFCRSIIKDFDTVWEQKLNKEEIEWGKSNTLQHLQDCKTPIESSDLEFIRGYSCVYSLTQTEIPIVSTLFDRDLNSYPGFVLMGGMSGVGAKGSLAYGLIASNLLLQKNELSKDYNNAVKKLGLNTTMINNI